MKKTMYVKPKMIIVRVTADQVIADNPCMPHTSHGQHEWYYDWPGDGWVHIHMSGENCSGDHNVEYYEYLDNTAIPGEQSDEEKAKALAYVQNEIINNKQRFSELSPEPGPQWS